MPKQLATDSDPLAIKPIIEALIFASEEPLSSRTLIRLLSGENARPSERVPSLIDISDEAREAVTEDAQPEEPHRIELALDDEPAEPPIQEPPVEEPPVDRPDVGEPESESVPAGTDVIDHARSDEISLIVEEGAGEDIDEEAGTSQGVNEPDDLADAIERARVRTSRKAAASPDADSIDQRYVRRLIEELNHEYDESNRAFRIVEVAGGFQFATMREYGEYVAMLSKEKGRRRLSPAALETLAIIAYRQPVSKPEIESIRGVNCDQVLLNLMEKNLVVITGRSEGVGRPLLYGTSDDFLRSFGLNSISDLPKLREIEELMEDGALSATRAEILEIAETSNAEEIEAQVGAMGHRGEEASTEGEEEPAMERTGDAANAEEETSEGKQEEVESEGAAM
jgi:segregation and condensation protein B